MYNIVTLSNRDGARRGTARRMIDSRMRFLAARGVNISARKIVAARARSQGEALKTYGRAESRNVLRAQVRHSCASDSLRNARRAFTLSFITRRASSPRMHIRVTAYEENVPAHICTRGTVDINNTLADVEAVDMSSENPIDRDPLRF